jgi:hypothetical protein
MPKPESVDSSVFELSLVSGEKLVFDIGQLLVVSHKPNRFIGNVRGVDYVDVGLRLAGNVDIGGGLCSTEEVDRLLDSYAANRGYLTNV